ncbi:STAS-like domain-containing protein [Hwanghaeella sp. LZ110]|uniref:STAS-like domain-containing protein n=1 Tax=Hwanghaeella sp. LZ110 TaxID=3402810 RepID=UPI003B6727AE
MEAQTFKATNSKWFAGQQLMGESTFEISIARDFSRTPGPRFIRQGEASGEKFRRSVLQPALERYQFITVILDGTAGYGSSFIDEAFGGLIRVDGFSADELRKRIRIISNEEVELIRDVDEAFSDAVHKTS